MIKRYIFLSVLIMLFLSITITWGQEIKVEALSDKSAAGLDLEAVAELFAETESLEDFELKLNDAESGINNLDLDEDGYVDYILITEKVDGYTHFIVLQALLGEDEIQDVAVIEIDQSSENDYSMYVQGDETLYGPDYYYVPENVHIHTWPIVIRLYRPVYRPYRSAYYWGHYPPTWKARKPVPAKMYRIRTARFKKNVFIRHRANVIHTKKINHQAKRSERVKTRKSVRADKPVKTKTKEKPQSKTKTQQPRSTNRR